MKNGKRGRSYNVLKDEANYIPENVWKKLKIIKKNTKNGKKRNKSKN